MSTNAHPPIKERGRHSQEGTARHLAEYPLERATVVVAGGDDGWRSLVIRRCLAVIAVGALCFFWPNRAIGGEAKGTLSFKSTILALKFAYLVQGPDAFDASQKIRRVVLSTTDLGPKLQACAKMSCTDGAVTEGMTLDLTGGSRLNYWVVLKGGHVQYSGTAELSALKARTDEPTKLAGTLKIDDAAADGAKIDVEFDSVLLKEFTTN